MLEHTRTVRAESVDRAIQLGLAQLDLTEEEASINVISQGKRGLFGFGRQDAIVEVSRKTEDLSLLDLTDQLEEAQEAEDQETLEVEEVVEETFDDQGQVQEVKTQKVEVETESPQMEEIYEEEVDLEPEVDQEEVVESPEDQAVPVEEEDKDQDQDEDQPSRQEVLDQVAGYLEDVIREYGAQADVEVVDQGQKVIFEIETDKTGLVIGRHGRIINSLQVLAQVMLYRYETRRTSLVLNVGNYRDRRAYVLEQIADRAARQVLKTKQPKVLDPLPAYERKQIHHHLSKMDHIATHSEGKDPNRYLVVTYKD